MNKHHSTSTESGPSYPDHPYHQTDISSSPNYTLCANETNMVTLYEGKYELWLRVSARYQGSITRRHSHW